jgi:hypothetical protein
MNAVPYRFLHFGPRASAPVIAAPPAPGTRQPLGYAGDDYAQSLARALDAIHGEAPRSAPALGEDLLAQALLHHARNNVAPGQADPSVFSGAGAAGGGHGGGSMSNFANTDYGTPVRTIAPFAANQAPSPGGLAGPNVGAFNLKPPQNVGPWPGRDLGAF